MESITNRLSAWSGTSRATEKSWSRADALSARRDRASKVEKKRSDGSGNSVDFKSMGSGDSDHAFQKALGLSPMEATSAFVSEIEEKMEDQTETLELAIKVQFNSEFAALHRKLDKIIAGINDCRRPLQYLPRARSHEHRGASKGQALSDKAIVSELHPDWEGTLPCNTENAMNSIRDSAGVPTDPEKDSANGGDCPEATSVSAVADEAVVLPKSPKSATSKDRSVSTIRSSSERITFEESLRSHGSALRYQAHASGSGSLSLSGVLQAANRENRGNAVAAQVSDLNRAMDARGFGWWRNKLMPILILSSVLIPMTQAIEPLELDAHIRVVLEVSLDVIFTIEIMFRFAVTHSLHHYIANFYIWIDIVEFLMSVVPALRLAKMLRRFEKFHLLLRAFEVSLEALPVLVYTVSMLVLTFSAMVFMVEDRDTFGTWFLSIWFTIVSMTTVGYGDVTPQSSLGKVIVSVLLWSSALYMAIPIGIVGNAFSVVWQDRDRLLLMHRTRERFIQFGFLPEDILDFFYVFDSDKDGALSLKEFKTMMSQLRVGFSEDRVCELFNLLDRDMSGKIDDAEFVRSLFPRSYESIYKTPSHPPPEEAPEPDVTVDDDQTLAPVGRGSQVSFAQQVQVTQLRS